jgi:stage IV sporulation protein FB
MSDQYQPQENGLRIGSFAGAPVVIEPTFLLLAAYVVGSALMRQGSGALGESLVFVGVIFLAILIHEFGHAAMAAALKIQSRRLVLTFFGGYVQFVHPPQKAWQEIAVSAAGPGANLASWALAASALPLLAPAMGYSESNLVVLNAISTFAWLSLLLGLFNLIPGFPLDGGHILRAALTYVVSRRSARMIAAYVGLVVAGGLAIWALSQMMIWTLFIAGLLGLAAWAELRGARSEPQFDSRSNA